MRKEKNGIALLEAVIFIFFNCFAEKVHLTLPEIFFFKEVSDGVWLWIGKCPHEVEPPNEISVFCFACFGPIHETAIDSTRQESRNHEYVVVGVHFDLCLPFSFNFAMTEPQ